MARVAEPLRKMGARFALTAESFAPLTVEGTAELTGIDWNLKVASAQVKSAILLAGLFARGTTRLTGEIHSRDHTERMLPHFGVQVETSPGSIAIAGGQRLRAAQIAVPADPSSAAFWLAAACVVRGGRVQIKGLLLNPSRTGFLRAIQRMGAQVTERLTAKEPELVGEVEVRGSALRGVSIPNQEVASLIDELPMLAVLACYAEGVTEVHGAEELRVKETDRIEAVAKNLNRMGAQIETFPDGFRIRGPQPLRGARIDSFGDHRIAMAFAVGALGADGPTTIENAESVGISYPTFFETLRRLSHRG
jgi:3-phosphoshikimate 1-carboxyvinyltransferase